MRHVLWVSLSAVVLLLSPVFAVRADDSVDDLLAKARQAFQEATRQKDAGQQRQLQKKALELAAKAIEKAPKSTDAYFLRATMHERMRQYDKAIADFDKVLELKPDLSGGYQRRGAAHFKAGHMKESIADFDRFLKAHPNREPHHWQRGISYYYAGEYAKGVRQFEIHKTVNPQDVENAVWHYLCKARIDGVDKARAALIDIDSDGRSWAMPVYEMFQGKLTPKQLLAKMKQGDPKPSELNYRLFFSHLYIGLYYESLGKQDLVRKHVTAAAKDYASDHYMGDVARVHVKLLNKRQQPKDR